MEPPVESLLDQVDSKFTLVTLAAMRARQINSYFNQLGEGLGAIVPPQVTSVSRKPLSIALEEIAAGKITYHRRCGRSTGAEEATRRRRGRPGERPSNSGRRAALRGPHGSCSGCPAASPPTRPSRCAGASSTLAPTSRPVLTPDATRFVGAADLLGARLRAGPHLAVGRPEPDPAHPARPERRPDRGGPGHRPAASAPTPPASPTTCSPPPCWPPGRRCWCARPCTPRCGSTPPCRTTWPCCAGRGVHVVEPATRAAGRRRRRCRAAWPSRRHRGGRAPRWCRRRPGRPGRRRAACVVTAGGTREPIDPVRFIGNRSSGKQGHALAAELAARGAQVILVTTVEPARARRASRWSRSRRPPRWQRRRPGRGRRGRRHRHGCRRRRLPAEGGRRRKLKKADGPPDSCSSRPPTSWPARAGRRPGQLLVGFAAETAAPGRHCGLRRRQACGQEASTSSSPTTWPPPASASGTTPTRS